jgi:hypothetical protein
MVLVARGGRPFNQLPNPNNPLGGGHWYLKQKNPIDPKELGFSLEGGYPKMPYNNSLKKTQLYPNNKLGSNPNAHVIIFRYAIQIDGE